MVLSVTAKFSTIDTEDKGGSYIVQLANLLIDEDVVFVVAGKNYPKESYPGNLIALGKITDQNELACLYSTADLCLITSKHETFGMAVAESLCCGTPIIGFKAGGPESIVIDESTKYFEFGDTQSLNLLIRNYIKGNVSYTVDSSKAKTIYSRESMLVQYNELYRTSLSKG